MAFNFTNYAALPVPRSPLNVMLSKALEAYTSGTKAAYAPQQQRADIFAKQFGPLATLATTPMFLQNPKLQEALGQFVSQHFGSQLTGNQSQANAQNLPTYADQAQQDLRKANALADQLTKAGKIKTGASNWAATAENYLGDFGKGIINFFTGNKITPELSNQEKQLDTYLATMKNNVLQTGRMSQKDADELFARRKDETPKQTLKRVEQSVPNLFGNNALSKEDQTYKDNQDLNFAIDLSEQIKERTGKDVPENLIFDYMQKHPGKLNIANLLKAVGAM